MTSQCTSPTNPHVTRAHRGTLFFAAAVLLVEFAHSVDRQNLDGSKMVD